MSASVDLLWSKMVRDLQSVCDENGVMGYSLIDLLTGRRACYREDVLFPTASTIKIPVLIGLALRVSKGEIGWDSRMIIDEDDRVGGSGILTYFRYPAEVSLWDLAALMISLSDNTATNRCIDLAGMDRVNHIMETLGLRRTRLRRYMMDYEAAKRGEENVSTPSELAELMRKLYQRDGIPAAVAEDVLTLLQLPKGGAFSRAIPREVKRANKPGGLGHLSVDAGLVFMKTRVFSLAVMGSFLSGDPDEATSSLIKMAYGYMDLLDKCTDLGRS